MMRELLAVAVCFAVWFLLYKPWFKDHQGFVDSLRYSLRPDIWSLIKGDWTKDMIEEFRLWTYIMLGLGAGVLVYWKSGGDMA
ncbi:MAG: hypothetical protein KDD43_02630, partial [Bdellovibrionales bacterium]|nr:hypothetical protein [Bdellovibrionales bacterium]